MSTHRKALIEWLKTKDIKCDNVLDIGGHVWSVKGNTKTWSVKRYSTLGENNGDFIYDLNESTTNIPFEDFNVVFCLEVMQFIYNPLWAIENIGNLLKKDGRAYFSFHLTHPPMKSHDYLRYTKKGAIKLLEEGGFEVKEIVEPIIGYYLIETCLKH